MVFENLIMCQTEGRTKFGEEERKLLSTLRAQITRISKIFDTLKVLLPVKHSRGQFVHVW